MIDFDSIADLNVLFVGDAIIDEYCYVEALGKSPKEHLIATRLLESESFSGGVEAAARHLETFVKSVRVMSGTKNVVKRRFVDRTYLRKLFEVQFDIENVRVPEDCVFGDYDVVVVTDFGHGAVDHALQTRLENEARFLVVNAQTNAANYGYNLITKYRRADLVVIDEPEARLAAKDRSSPLEVVMRSFKGFDRIIVTHGRFGACGLLHEGFFQESAFTEKVVDTMGAGDAFLSVVAPLAAKQVGMRDLLRAGNAAGALKTQIVGHRSSVTKEALVEYLAVH